MARNEGKVNLGKDEEDAGGSNVDTSNLLQKAKESEAAAEKKQKELAEKLAKVVVKVEDVKYLMDELEIPKDKAELLLKSHDNDIQKALAEFTTPNF